MSHDLSRGLSHDLDVWMTQARARRQALRWLLGAGAASLVGCGGGGGDEAGDATSSTGWSGSSSSAATGTGTTTTGTTTASSCTVIPEETAGPYPGDGSNSSSSGVANALALSGIVRSDIRSSVAGASGTASGVPLQIVIELVNASSACADLSGYAIYLWHCDALGRYSMYSSGVTAENYLRGVQATGSDGIARFTTIFPGCYLGRVPHVHFEIYRSTTTATSWSNKLRTSQLTFPTEVCSAVYATSGYGSSASNAAQISLATDNIFSDGYATQMATVTGSAAAGYVATLRVGIAA